MVQTPTKPITLQEFCKLPETEPASEYIEGEIIQKPMPQGRHSRLQLKLCNTINGVTEVTEIALALPELRCTFGGRSLVPDIAVFTWDRIPLRPNGDIADVFNAYPDWVVEILSPDQSPTKVINNLLHCLNHGSSLGWMLDPDERSVLVFPPNQQPIVVRASEALIPVPQWADGLQLTVGRVFGWLQLRSQS